MLLRIRYSLDIFLKLSVVRLRKWLFLFWKLKKFRAFLPSSSVWIPGSSIKYISKCQRKIFSDFQKTSCLAHSLLGTPPLCLCFAWKGLVKCLNLPQGPARLSVSLIFVRLELSSSAIGNISLWEQIRLYPAFWQTAFIRSLPKSKGHLCVYRT